MRGALILVGVVLGTGLALGAPVPTSGPEPAGRPPRDLAAAHVFARELLGVTDQVADQYVRPVPREQLLRAALAGLYEAARRPAPPDLADRIKAALPKPAPDAPPTRLGALPSALPTGADRALLALIGRVRLDVDGSEALQGRNPLLVCCQAMAGVLDPHSGVVTAAEQRRAIGLDAECDGVGLELNGLGGDGPVLVTGVQPGGPAQRAGVRPGDEITHIDGKKVGRAAGPELLPLLDRHPDAAVPPLVDGGRLPEGPARPVRVTLRQAGARGRTITLVRERFRPETVLGVARRDDNSWDYLADRKRLLAHVRLATLGRGTAEELRGVLAGLDDEGVRGLILDLRWCPGGFLNEAVAAAELFLGEGTIATVKSRAREDTVYRSTSAGKLVDFPVVVLVNGATSGGAELIAAALQDHKRVVVAGQRTLGKASVQTPLSLGLAGVGFKLTTGTFVRPSGKNLHRFPDSRDADDWGVRPDDRADFRISADLSRELCKWWQQQTLRPGPSRQRLPLDDPTADPQRQEALEVLAELLDRKVRARAECPPHPPAPSPTSGGEGEKARTGTAPAPSPPTPRPRVRGRGE